MKTKKIIATVAQMALSFVVMQLLIYHLLCIEADTEWAWTPWHRLMVGNELVLLIGAFFTLVFAPARHLDG